MSSWSCDHAGCGFRFDDGGDENHAQSVMFEHTLENHVDPRIKRTFNALWARKQP